MSAEAMFDLVVMDRFMKHPASALMRETVEASPWHREANVLVHTQMTIAWYEETLHEYRTDRQRILTKLALLFHDTGKPEARQEKFSEARGKYSSFGGHEIVSARHFEAFMADNTDLLELLNITWLDVLAVAFVIENHLPYELKREKAVNLRTAVNAYLGDDETVFTDVLLSDTHGRTSDDAETKRRKVFDYVFAFKAIEPQPMRMSRDDPVLFVLVGASGSGKSTWTQRYIDSHPDEKISIFSLDTERVNFYTSSVNLKDDTDPIKVYRDAFRYANDNSAKFNSFAAASFVEKLKSGSTVIVDNVNASRKARRQWMSTAHQKGYKTWAVMFPMSPARLADRSDIRTDKKVPTEAITRQFMSISVPWIGSEVNSISVIAPN